MSTRPPTKTKTAAITIIIQIHKYFLNKFVELELLDLKVVLLFNMSVTLATVELSHVGTKPQHLDTVSFKETGVIVGPVLNKFDMVHPNLFKSDSYFWHDDCDSTHLRQVGLASISVGSLKI
jgi:hypothetical protein